jgi:FimV-like protein
MSQPEQNTDELLRKLGKSLERLRVLIVDRNSGSRSSLRIILSTLGVTFIRNASTSSEVLRQVKSCDFDVILADYVLDDDRDGQQLLEELRQSQLISLSTVYMLITAERAYQNVVSVAELTPDDYLIKPFTAETLEGRLVRALYKKRFFEPVYRLLDNGAYADALAACEALAWKDEQFLPDVLRQQGAILNTLGRHKEARDIYRQAIEHGQAPWARMGLATALRGLGELAEAENIGLSLISEYPEYLAAYDFVASVCEEQGRLEKAQEMLQKAAAISPNNSLRQRAIGDIAVRNDDLEVAERAYGKTLERRRGSSLQTIDDYTRLASVMLDRGHADGAHRVTQELRRDWRGHPRGELAALVLDSLCARREDEPGKAKEALDKALALRGAAREDGDTPGDGGAGKIDIDLARACLEAGDEEKAREILGKVAAENYDDRDTIARIQAIYAKAGKEEAGKSLLASVGKEIVELNDRGVKAAQGGDDKASMQALIEAAERVPSVAFLTDASQAIFRWLDRAGWNEEQASRALRYLQQAQAKDARSPKVVAARETYFEVARKYGIEAAAHGVPHGARR